MEWYLLCIGDDSGVRELRDNGLLEGRSVGSRMWRMTVAGICAGGVVFVY